MNAIIIAVSFLVFAAASIVGARRARPSMRIVAPAANMILWVFVFPIFLWFPVYVSVDFSSRPEYSDDFLNRIYFTRDNENKLLPVNGDRIIAEREYSEEADGKRRVVILGDSFAAGYGLKYEDTLGARLQDVLGDGYEVINGAFYGTNAEMQVEFFLNHLSEYETNTIVIRQRMDDVMPLTEKYYLEQTADIIRKYAPHWPLAVKDLIFRGEVFLVRNKYWRYFSKNREESIENDMLLFYRRLNEYTSNAGIRVLMLIDDCPQDYEDVCEAAGRQAEDLGWQTLDLRNDIDLSGDDMAIPGDGHPSARANELLAELVAERLVLGEPPDGSAGGAGDQNPNLSDK